MRPKEIHLHQKSKVLELVYENGTRHNLPCEYLRVFSPSAEVRGHGPGQEVLQIGKEDVNISAIEPTGNYAVKLVFTDGHDTGIYDWDLLYRLGESYRDNWQDYLARLNEAGHSRKSD